MPKFYPSYQALLLADAILEEVAHRVEGYQGRVGVSWHWRLPGGILATVNIDFTVTEQRWDLLRGQAVSPAVGFFHGADFPFAAYGTLASSPPFIHDLDGEAEWANRMYFQMGYLIEDMTLWLDMLRAAIIEPQIRPPATIPDITPLQRELVNYAVNELNGDFHLKELYAAFDSRISRQRLSRLAQEWEQLGLLTERPRRVTVALRSLSERECCVKT